MPTRFATERTIDFDSFRRMKSAGRLPFAPLDMAHAYIKLDFKPQYENAGTAQDARGFLRSVARAAMAADEIAGQYSGVVLEVQGSTLHVGLPPAAGGSVMDSANAFVADLHWAYRAIFNDPRSRVEGWRMTVDTGRTMVVAGRGVHGDDSWVSLGESANRPAKHLYAQLEEPEDRRALKRFYIGIRNPLDGRWIHESLDRTRPRLTEAKAKSIAESVRSADPRLDFVSGLPQRRDTSARALPIDPAGQPAAPSADTPQTHFGWVMRTDLDGFTARVEQCFGDDLKLGELASEFYRIMDDAAQFVAQHKETLAQLPWAGDNFTAAAVFRTRDEYDRAAPTRLVELSLDFEKEMDECAVDCGFGGWAHGVAGGTVHGNANGNVYLAGIEVRDRRFLVGAGEGFGRSAQAFGDINPKAKQLVLYQPDWERLDDAYKAAFEPAVTRRGQQSSLYRIAKIEALVRIRARRASIGVATVVSLPASQTRPMAPRPYFQ